MESSVEKTKLKILLLENIHPIAKQRLESEGFHVDLKAQSPSEEDLVSLVKDYDVLGVRSKTNLSSRTLESSKRLLTVGCFCIGTNQIDLEAANSLGVPIFNAPYSNTRSVAEMVIAEMICLALSLEIEMFGSSGGAEKRRGFLEVRGKTVGIGGTVTLVVRLASGEAIGMKVIFATF